MSREIELQKEYNKLFKELKKKYPKPLGKSRDSKLKTLIDVTYRGKTVREEIEYKPIKKKKLKGGVEYRLYRSNIYGVYGTTTFKLLSSLKRLLKYGEPVTDKSEYDKIKTFEELTNRFLRFQKK